MTEIEILNRLIKWHEARIAEKRELFELDPSPKFTYLALGGEHDTAIMALTDLIEHFEKGRIRVVRAGNVG